MSIQYLFYIFEKTIMIFFLPFFRIVVQYLQLLVQQWCDIRRRLRCLACMLGSSRAGGQGRGLQIYPPFLHVDARKRWQWRRRRRVKKRWFFNNFLKKQQEKKFISNEEEKNCRRSRFIRKKIPHFLVGDYVIPPKTRNFFPTRNARAHLSWKNDGKKIGWN